MSDPLNDTVRAVKPPSTGNMIEEIVVTATSKSHEDAKGKFDFDKVYDTKRFDGPLKRYDFSEKAWDMTEVKGNRNFHPEAIAIEDIKNGDLGMVLSKLVRGAVAKAADGMTCQQGTQYCHIEDSPGIQQLGTQFGRPRNNGMKIGGTVTITTENAAKAVGSVFKKFGQDR